MEASCYVLPGFVSPPRVFDRFAFKSSSGASAKLLRRECLNPKPYNPITLYPYNPITL